MRGFTGKSNEARWWRLRVSRPSFGVETSTSKKDKRDYQENLRRKAEEKKLDAAAFTIWVTSDEAQVAIAEEFDIAEDEEEE